MLLLLIRWTFGRKMGSTCEGLLSRMMSIYWGFHVKFTSNWQVKKLNHK
jgi:hypothetical protein